MSGPATLPDFLVVGAQRAGTTWLDGVLRGHPEVYLPTRRKEVHFFDQHFDRGVDWYRGFFPPASARPRAVGEITPKYLFDPRVPARIAQVLPAARLVAILREPVARMYSQYGLHVRDRGERRSFEAFARDEAEAFARGLYAEQLARFQAWWCEGRLLVLIFEEVVAARDAALESLGRFLGVEPASFPPDQRGEKVNASFRPRHPRARAAARRLGAWLRRHDADRVVNLAKRVGVPGWFGSAGALPPLEPAVHARWRARYAEDRDRLEAMLGRRIDAWADRIPG